jgi:hypothetical protein
MNAKLLLLLVFSLAIFACSKSNSNPAVGPISASQVPSAVMSAFNAKYPAASGQIEWELEDGNTYKVKYYIGSQRWQARFTAAGGFISEQQI